MNILRDDKEKGIKRKYYGKIHYLLALRKWYPSHPMGEVIEDKGWVCVAWGRVKLLG